MKIGRGETNHLYCDVDGTLLIWPSPGNPGGPTAEQSANAQAAVLGKTFRPEIMPRVNADLVDNIRRWQDRSGGTLIIWSMGGPSHAEMARALCKFEKGDRLVCLGKPDLAVDDNPLVWSKRTLDVVAPDKFKV